MDKKELIKIANQGYRVISRKYLIASRVDRKDWQKHAKFLHPHSSDVWTDADFYRRVITKDWIHIPIEFIGKLPNSSNTRNKVDYCPK